jgi:hypothetical protein
MKSGTGKIPNAVVFNEETLRRVPGKGDNWCLTWAADDSIITSMDDGNWLDADRESYHHHLYRIEDGPDNFKRSDIPGYPDFSSEEGSWFGYGIISVDGVLYSAVSKTPGTQWTGPFTGVKLLRSQDNGKTWHRIDRENNARKLGPMDDARNLVTPREMFSLKEFGIPHKKQQAYPFSYFDFVQFGKDNAFAQDDYLYMYSPEGAQAHKLILARVNKNRLGVRKEWEYFKKYENGEPLWSSDIQERGPVHVFPEKSGAGHYFGWYSWLPSVVWNPGLGLYIMANGGTYGGYDMTDSDKDYYDAWMHTQTGSLGFWYSEKPWGPWHEIYYTDYWIVDSPENRTYQPKLSPKWISDSGQKMVLIWSDAMKNAQGKSHTINYIWNQMQITIRL